MVSLKLKFNTLTQQGKPKWVRILDRKDLDKLELIFSLIVVLLHTNKLPQIKVSELQLGSAPLTLHYLIHNKQKGTRTFTQ